MVKFWQKSNTVERVSFVLYVIVIVFVVVTLILRFTGVVDEPGWGYVVVPILLIAAAIFQIVGGNGAGRNAQENDPNRR